MDHQLLIYVEDAMTQSSLFPGLVSYPLFYPLFLRPALSFVQILFRGNANLLLDIRPTVIFFPIDLSYRTPFVVFPMLSMRVNRPSIHCISPHRLSPHFSQMLDFSNYRFSSAVIPMHFQPRLTDALITPHTIRQTNTSLSSRLPYP